MTYSPRTRQSRLAYQTNNKPSHIVLKMDAASELLEITAAARFAIRVPPPPTCDFRIEVSTDQGSTWSTLANPEIPPDNEYSSGWMYGRSVFNEPNRKKSLVRIQWLGIRG